MRRAADRFERWLDGPSFGFGWALLIAFPASILIWALLFEAFVAMGAGQ